MASKNAPAVPRRRYADFCNKICAKRTIAHPPAIAVIAGHAIERAARLLRNCRLLDVPLQIMKMPPAAGRAFKSLNLSNLITILKK
jgi:hypothetical protein